MQPKPQTQSGLDSIQAQNGPAHEHPYLAYFAAGFNITVCMIERKSKSLLINSF